MSSAPYLLQPVPPIAPRKPRGRVRHSLPAHNSKAEVQRRKLTITCGARRSPDDYHATVRALNSRGHRPRKSLGQHYMLNSEVNEQLAAAANVQDADVVLEIGPGTGSLTNVLLDTGATVLAIEKDPHMAALVKQRFAYIDRLKVLQEDFVKCHIGSHMFSLFESISSLDQKPRCAKVVSNIPFNISTDVVKQLLPMGDIFSDVVLLLQEETALRLVESSLRTSEYRPINIFVNFYSDPEYKFKVPRSAFFPQPNVNSAFNGKRKMLRRSLQHIFTSLEIEEALENVGLAATSRPEELTLDDFVKLHNLIARV